MPEVMGEGHLLGQALKQWPRQGHLSQRAPLAACPTPPKNDTAICVGVCIFWVYSPLFQALSLSLLYSNSIVCTVSSSSSRFSGFTV